MSVSPAPSGESASALDADVDQAIALCNGDLRATVRALIVMIDELENRARRLHADVSRGYSRGVHDGLHHPLLRAGWPSSAPATTEPAVK